jgi:hypothetical protein
MLKLDTLLLILMLLVSTEGPLAVPLVLIAELVLLFVLDALLLLFSVNISTLNLTLRARNLSGDRYSQRNKLGLFMLCIKS